MSDPSTVGEMLAGLPPVNDDLAARAAALVKPKRKRAPNRKRPTVTAFEKHNLRNLSASSLRLFREQPAAWVVRYLMKIKSEMGPPVWRGDAVEAGLNAMLLGGAGRDEALVAANAKWDERAQGECSDKALKEQADIPAYLDGAYKFLSDEGLTKPLTSQSKINLTVDEIDVPLIGYIDYGFEKFDMDLKTTGRMPSEPKPEHVVQLGVYQAARKKPQFLLYVTPKKVALYEVGKRDAEKAYADLVEGAKALQRFLDRFEDAADALSVLYPDYSDDFTWSPEMIAAAKQAQKGKQ